MNSRINGRAGKLRGQALVEFALAFTIFLIVMLAIIEFGRLLIAYSSSYAAAREAARYGAASDIASKTDASRCSEIRQAAYRVGFLGGIDSADQVDISYNGVLCNLTCSNCPMPIPASGSLVTVTVHSQFKFLVLSLPEIDFNTTSARSIISDLPLNPAQP